MFLCFSKKTISLVILLLLSIQAFSQFLNKNVEAKLISNQTNGIITITGIATNKTDINQGLSYKFTAFKTDQNGNKSNNQQSGQLDLLANQTKTLSSTSINKGDKSRIIILLLIYDSDNKLIGKDRIVLNDKPKTELEKKQEDVKVRASISEFLKQKETPVQSKEEQLDDIEAKIDVKQNNEYLSIVGSAFNKTDLDKSLKYKLIVSKIDQSENNVLYQQDERFVLLANSKKELITKTFNKEVDIKIIISLIVYNTDDEIVGRDRVIINKDGTNTTESKQKTAEQSKNKQEKSLDIKTGANDGAIIKGIVVEDTKTKPGRDFYKLFYNI